MPHQGRRARRCLRRVIAELLEVNAVFRLRAAQGVVGLADKNGPARLETACAKRIVVDAPLPHDQGHLGRHSGGRRQPLSPGGDGRAAAFLHGPRGCS